MQLKTVVASILVGASELARCVFESCVVGAEVVTAITGDMVIVADRRGSVREPKVGAVVFGVDAATVAAAAGDGFGVTTTVMFLLGPIVRPECCLSIVISDLFFSFDTDLTLLKVTLLLLLMLLF